MRRVKIILILAVTLSIGVLAVRTQIGRVFFSPRPSQVEEGFTRKELDIKKEESPEENIEIIAEDLKIPWELVFLPNGEMLVTERAGKLIKIGKERRLISQIEGVEHAGEGGLLGLALHPEFDKNKWIYLYFTSKTESGLVNRVERYKLENDRITDKKVILQGIAGARFHDGGRMEFGPDGYLYITTGDAGNKPAAQDTSSLNGKILRIKDDGTIPDDNPFGNAVYSYGHRNPQGMAWDEKGRLWITEHGPSGINTGFDEINLIEKGNNYGWPELIGNKQREGMTSPIIQSGAEDTWAPAGMVYFKGSFFFAGLRGESVYEAKLIGSEKLILTAHFRKVFGRIRVVVLGPDNNLYLATSNTDGRGDERKRDDKIIRINSQVFR
jgi:glucose/arabinose dehydrogenase